MRLFTTLLLLFLLVNPQFAAESSALEVKARIHSVKLFQNQARIYRVTEVILKKGINTVAVSGLPLSVYNWSVRGNLNKSFKGKIVSLEVEKKAQVSKRRTRILKIEEKLNKLRDKDQVYIDELSALKSEEKFCNSILNFTSDTAKKEVRTRIPQIVVWDRTLSYVSRKKRSILSRRRTIEKKRESLGKKIQKWEFELSQIGGSSYFRTYQDLNNALIQNRSSLQVQQYANITGRYGERKRSLYRPGKAVSVDIEKRIVVRIFSPKNVKTRLRVSYIIPGTYWKMKYDFRASRGKNQIAMAVYGDIYQNTGEDWKGVRLYLSTGLPARSIQVPTLYPWFLDLHTPRPTSRISGNSYKSYAKKSMKYEGDIAEEAELPAKTRIRSKGPTVEITLPLKQTILSSKKYQKKFIQEYRISGKKNLEYYYELRPERAPQAYIMAAVTNTTSVPWMRGKAQVFLDGEYMGNIILPQTERKQRERLAIGIEPRIVTEKKMIKKYEDTSGLFGNKRRIVYEYRVLIKNRTGKRQIILLKDVLPVSRNEKIKVEFGKMSMKPVMDARTKKSTEYVQGIRKWKISIPAQGEQRIDYTFSITFDKDSSIQGLR